MTCFGGLRRDPPEALGRMLSTCTMTTSLQLRFRIVEPRAFQGNLGGVAEDIVDYFFFDEDLGSSGIGIDFRFYRLGRAGAGIFAISGNQSALQGIQNNIRRQRAHLRDLIEGDLQFVQT